MTTAVQPPVPAQAIRRAAGRRRRCRRAVLSIVCAVAVAGLWGSARALPVFGAPQDGVGAAGEEHRIAAEIPLPGPAADDDDSELFLPVEALPTAEGHYGPWVLTGEGGLWSAEAPGGGTPQPMSEPPPTCLSRGVGAAGAAVALERSYADGSGEGAAAAQYVLVFSSDDAAARAVEALLAPLDCGAALVGVVDCDRAASALWTAQAGAVVEEITVQQVGVRVVALAVHHGGTSVLVGGGGTSTAPSVPSPPSRVAPSGVIQPEFVAAAAELRTRLAEFSSQDGSPAASPMVSAPGTLPGSGAASQAPEPACGPMSTASAAEPGR
ncbi:hypothetical protein [Kitasatospora sp. NPDC057223]|uniref:hypothetical protein n=1 Tax=Kitasatospora sp. NPDC057223 TaxID=3346055 RepID=UPI003642BAE4